MTLSRWKAEYGGLRIDPAKRLKELEQENARLKKIVAHQALDSGRDDVEHDSKESAVIAQ